MNFVFDKFMLEEGIIKAHGTNDTAEFDINGFEKDGQIKFFR